VEKGKDKTPLHKEKKNEVNTNVSSSMTIPEKVSSKKRSSNKILGLTPSQLLLIGTFLTIIIGYWVLDQNKIYNSPIIARKGPIECPEAYAVNQDKTQEGSRLRSLCYLNPGRTPANVIVHLFSDEICVSFSEKYSQECKKDVQTERSLLQTDSCSSMGAGCTIGNCSTLLFSSRPAFTLEDLGPRPPPERIQLNIDVLCENCYSQKGFSYECIYDLTTENESVFTYTYNQPASEKTYREK
jgi:hypothetical protein